MIKSKRQSFYMTVFFIKATKTAGVFAFEGGRILNH